MSDVFGRPVVYLLGGLLLAGALAVSAHAGDPPAQAPPGQVSDSRARYVRAAGAYIPDGGSAVIASYSTLREGRTEAGPPGLAQVPYLSRGFGNVAYGRSIRRGTVALGVRVISLREEEERQTGLKP